MDITSDLAKIAAELELVAARIAAARKGAGDILGLDAEIESLCRRLEMAPRDEARQQLPTLQTLMVELDLLAVDLDVARGAA